MNYFLGLLISIDQMFNSLLGGLPDETLSARAYRTEQSGKRFGKFFRPLIDLIMFFDKDHCYTSWLAEYRRKQLPNSYK